jgi:hypothetical protein
MMPTVRRAAGPGTIVLLLVASIAMAQVRLTLRGTIENAEGQTLVVKLQDGTMKNVQLADDVHVFTIKKSSLANVKRGSVVAVTASRQMDDSQKAAEIYIFPDQPRHQPGPTAKVISGSEVLEYIDGSVLSVQEPTLVIRSKEGEERITMPPDIRVVMLVPATFADIKAGQYFFIPEGTPTSLGTLAATIVVGSDSVDFAM